MKLYLNVYDYPLPTELLVSLQGLGWGGLRRDVEIPEEIPGILEEGEIFGFSTILLLNKPPGECESFLRACHSFRDAMVEVGNEWDTTASPLEAKAAWTACLPLLGEKMITGGITSLSSQALAWLGKALSPIFPNVGFHPYRTTEPPTPTIREDIRKLKALAPASRLWNTECGWHTAKSKVSCFKSVQFDDFQVANFLEKDVAYHQEEDVESYTVYQLNDGPNPKNYEDCFGIRRVDGTWKPSASLPARRLM